MSRSSVASLLLLAACAAPVPSGPAITPSELGLDGAVTPLAEPVTLVAGSFAHLGSFCMTRAEEGTVGAQRLQPRQQKHCASLATAPIGDGWERVTVTMTTHPLAGLVFAAERSGTGAVRNTSVSGPLFDALPESTRTTMRAIGEQMGALAPGFPAGRYSQGQVVTMPPPPAIPGLRNDGAARPVACTVTGRSAIRQREVIVLACDTSATVSAPTPGSGAIIRGQANATALVAVETATSARRRDWGVTAITGTATDPGRGTTIPVAVTIRQTAIID